MALPETKKLIENGILNSEIAAYLDLILKNDTSLVILGNHDERSTVIPAVKELASQYGKIYPIGHIGTLKSILFDKTPFKTNDFIVVNLYDDRNFAQAYLDLIASSQVKGLAEISGDSLNNIIQRLEDKGVQRTQLPYLRNILSVNLYNNKPRVKITELVGIEPETNELITNTLYLWNMSENYTCNEHSFLFERLQSNLNLTTDKLKKLYAKRIKKFEFSNK